MEILKKIWNFLFGSKKEEPVVLEETSTEETKEVVTHCITHIRFRKNCPDCLRAVGVI
jgi:hypothetical protein